MEFNNLKEYFGIKMIVAPVVIAAITEKKIKSSDLGITPRVLNYWKNQGLFLTGSEDEKHQHLRFSFEDYVWFSIIAELRKFNLGLNAIKKIKKSLYYSIPIQELIQYPAFIDEVIKIIPEIDKEEVLNILHSPEAREELEKQLKLNILTLLLVQAIILKQFVAIYVTYRGEVIPVIYNEIDKCLNNSIFQEFIKNTYISISLSDIIIKYIANTELKLSCGQFQLISEREAEIIRLLRDDKVESLTIHKENDKNEPVRLIEIEEKYDKVDKETRLLDMIIKNGYQSIEIKTQAGKIVHCKNIRKVKLE